MAWVTPLQQSLYIPVLIVSKLKKLLDASYCEEMNISDPCC